MHKNKIFNMSSTRLDTKITYLIKTILKGTLPDNCEVARFWLGIKKLDDDLLLLSPEDTECLVDDDHLQLPYLQ